MSPDISPESEINNAFPLPASADLLIKLCEAPEPIPIACTLLYLLFFFIYLITVSGDETSPSVRRNIYLGYSFFFNLLKIKSNGLFISVPPISAENY